MRKSSVYLLEVVLTLPKYEKSSVINCCCLSMSNPRPQSRQSPSRFEVRTNRNRRPQTLPLLSIQRWIIGASECIAVPDWIWGTERSRRTFWMLPEGLQPDSVNESEEGNQLEDREYDCRANNWVESTTTNLNWCIGFYFEEPLRLFGLLFGHLTHPGEFLLGQIHNHIS